MCTTVLKSIKSIHNQTDSQGQQQQIASRQHSQVSKQQKQQHSEKRLQKSRNDFSCMMNWRVNSEFSPFLLYFLTVYWYNNRVWMVVWREKDKRQRTMHRDILSPDDVSGRVPCRTSPEGAEDRPFSSIQKQGRKVNEMSVRAVKKKSIAFPFPFAVCQYICYGMMGGRRVS